MNEEKHIEIVPTCVPRDCDDFIAKIKQISAFSSAAHVDIDDGIMTPEFSWPYVGQGRLGELQAELDKAVVKTVDNFLMQIHLMVSDPREIGDFFIQAGAHTIIVQAESCDGDASRVCAAIDAWRDRGVREVGIAILLDTPIEKLEALLPCCDFVQVLSVATIGAQGAPFDPRAIGRISDLHARFPDLPIMDDGGVSVSNIASLAAAGATRFSVGSAIMRAPDPSLAYAQIKAAAETLIQ